jgi:hypothetical protein
MKSCFPLTACTRCRSPGPKDLRPRIACATGLFAEFGSDLPVRQSRAASSAVGPPLETGSELRFAITRVRRRSWRCGQRAARRSRDSSRPASGAARSLLSARTRPSLPARALPAYWFSDLLDGVSVLRPRAMQRFDALRRRSCLGPNSSVSRHSELSNVTTAKRVSRLNAGPTCSSPRAQPAPWNPPPGRGRAPPCPRKRGKSPAAPGCPRCQWSRSFMGARGASPLQLATTRSLSSSRAPLLAPATLMQDCAAVEATVCSTYPEMESGMR